jgi:hypothetical protein
MLRDDGVGRAHITEGVGEEDALALTRRNRLDDDGSLTLPLLFALKNVRLKRTKCLWKHP